MRLVPYVHERRIVIQGHGVNCRAGPKGFARRDSATAILSRAPDHCSTGGEPQNDVSLSLRAAKDKDANQLTSACGANLPFVGLVASASEPGFPHLRADGTSKPLGSFR